MGSQIHASQLSLACLGVLALLWSGCIVSPRPRTSYEANSQVLALNQLVVFQDSTGSLSYHAPTGKDVRIALAPRVKGTACQHGISVPLIGMRNGGATSLSVGWGAGAYKEALGEARAGLPKDAVLFDVRADLNQFAILTIYRRQCLLLDAAVAVPIVPTAAPAVPAPPPAPAESAPAPAPAPSVDTPPEPPPPFDPAASGLPPPVPAAEAPAPAPAPAPAKAPAPAQP